MQAHTNPAKMQIHAPNTVPHGRILQNTYLSDLDLDAISEKLDLEMAANLGQLWSCSGPSDQSRSQQPLSEDAIGGRVLNLHCSYNFRPANFNFLMLSRFSFATKKRRIHKLIRKKVTQQRQQLKQSLNRVEEMENKVLKDHAEKTAREHAALEAGFPKFYKEKIEARVKQEEVLNQQGIELGRTGPAKLEYAPPHLYPQQGVVTHSMASLG